MENIYKPTGALFAAAVGQLTAVMGTLWAVIALFGGTKGAAVFDQVPPVVLWAALAVCFAALHLLLRKPRPLLCLIAVCLVLAAAMAAVLGKAFVTGADGADGVSGADGAYSDILAGVVVGCFGAALMITMLFQLRWETGRFKDSTLLVQMQILLLIGVCQIWLADQLEIETTWIFPSFGAAALVLCGALVSKTSGLKDEKTGKGGPLRRGLLMGGAVAGCGLTAILAAGLAEPVGSAIASGYGAAKGILSWLLTGLGKILGFLFTRNKVRLDEAAQSGGDDGTAAAGQMMAESGGDGDFFRTVFHIIILALLAFLAFVIVRALLRLAVGAGRRAVQKRGRTIEKDGTLRERIMDWIKNLKQTLRAKRILRRHPDSVAALLVELEARCRRDSDLMRRPGETARQFLTRLAEFTEAGGASSGIGKAGNVRANGEADPAEATPEGVAEVTSEGAAEVTPFEVCPAEVTPERAAEVSPAEVTPEEAAEVTLERATEVSPVEAAAALRRLADAVDAACYSKDGDWLASFAEWDKIQKFIFFSKKS